jgi:hypothetical protein
MNQPRFIIEEIDDPKEIVRCKNQDQRIQQNSAWLQAHWKDVLPQARGKFIAVAGQQLFIAETAAKAWAMAKSAHPDDDGAISQYIFPDKGPRVYGHIR